MAGRIVSQLRKSVGSRFFSHGEVFLAPAVNGISKASDRIIKLTLTNYHNQKLHVEGIIGESLLDCATRNNLKFVDICGTKSDPHDEWALGLQCYQCHCHLANEVVDQALKSSPVSKDEVDQLQECQRVYGDVNKSSRLACQVTLTKEFDGMTVLFPGYTY